MLDDYFVRALIAGLGVAGLSGPFGCFIIWRRLSYFGDTLAHGALLGIVLGLIANINLTLAVFAVCTFIAIGMTLLEKRANLSSDTILGILSHGTLAIGLVALALMSNVRLDLMGLLFGEILAVSGQDIAIIYGGGIAVLIGLIFLWRPLFAITVSEEIAAAEGVKTAYVRFAFIVMVALVIAIAMKIVGALLITALLIIPASTARAFASGPERMALFASLFGMASVVIGLFSSLQWDIPSGPSIVVAALFLFALTLTPLPRYLSHKRQTKDKAG